MTVLETKLWMLILLQVCVTAVVVRKQASHSIIFTTSIPAGKQRLYDTVFDVDHDKERAQQCGLELNGFSFDGADAVGVDYALNGEDNMGDATGNGGGMSI
ncbi:PREDICTED: uncharacterized protein LOC109240173 isoform X4 [Nicotiana attenuata]|uniref:uncharacterized protein LOC109240173 isoform X3 n=1 Tax=Nicotiana attenuata TaxID=49451 RepID=UPI000905680A|nr:PREDICTED: uncharacterized protein LOC109240173 isoform X3 [Nicotiana attenuata]XP_019262353.1 PREDICTED: uncharacterized protein LOC109240173 isoform X4 [Nicotiana attenuata]